MLGEICIIPRGIEEWIPELVGMKNVNVVSFFRSFLGMISRGIEEWIPKLECTPYVISGNGNN